MQNQKENFKALLQKINQHQNLNLDPGLIEILADQISESGAMVFPCQIGDIVYSIQTASCENIDGKYTECPFYGFGENDRMCKRASREPCPHQMYIERKSVTSLNLIEIASHWGFNCFSTEKEAMIAKQKMQ